MFDFAIDMEEAITRLLEILEKESELEIAQVLRLVLKTQKEFVQILKSASAVNIDLEDYNRLNFQLGKLAGEENALIQALGNKKITSPNNLCVLWLAQALLEKSAQYYAQAASNSQLPSLKLLVKSLGEVKNIQKLRLATCIRMAHNDVWEKVGFAPFVLGKD